MAITEFIPIGLKSTEVAGEVCSESNADLKDRVMLMCLKPLLFGIWVSDKNVTPAQVIFRSDAKIRAAISGEPESYMEVEGGFFCFWKPENTRLNALSLKQKAVELPRIFRQSRKSKFRFSYAEVKHLTAGYFYPRKIYVVVVEHADYLNVFPMDLHMQHPETDDYAFSLQVTNLATAKIKEVARVLVCQLGSESLKMAYALGKNHGRTKLTKAELPFSFSKSDHYGLLLPDFAIGYKEVEIQKYVDFSSHTVFTGKVTHEKAVAPEAEQPYHIHRFCYPYQNKQGENKSRLSL